MTPTKVRHLIPELAKQIGIPEEDLANMLSFYFKENKRIASKLEHPHIVLRGLGVLNIQGWLLEKKIQECEKSENLPLLDNALTRWNEERQFKKSKGVMKKQFYENKLNNNESQTEGTAPDSMEE